MYPFPQRRWYVVNALAILLTAVSGAAAPPGPKPAPPRLDRYGDPLPEGALARLGTLRLVHPGEISAAAVSPDGKLAATGVRQGKDVYLSKTILHQTEEATIYTGDRVTR